MTLGSFEAEIKEQAKDARCGSCRNIFLQSVDPKDPEGKIVVNKVVLDKTWDKENKEEAFGALCFDCDNAIKKGYPREAVYATKVIENGAKKFVSELTVGGLYDKPAPVKPKVTNTVTTPKADKKDRLEL